MTSLDATRGRCASCRFWRRDERGYAYYGHRYVGTCALGGPDPAKGNADCGPHETCERHEERRDGR